MPAAKSSSKRRGGRRQTALLFWVGVAVAPIAALLLVVGQGTGLLRAAAVLAVLGVVSIGLSVVFREDPAEVREEMTDTLRREVDQVREEVQAIRRGVEVRLRRELENVRVELEAARHDVVRRTETVSVHAERLVGGNELAAGSVRYTREIGSESVSEARRPEPARAESLRVESSRADGSRPEPARASARVSAGAAVRSA
ncbi:MAG: hypothetical protein JWN54_2509, partial [Mycobacterium sp.]|nr:hypothetical protein [Mycobacterium sp.]